MELSPLTNQALWFWMQEKHTKIYEKEVIYMYKFDHRFYIATNKVKSEEDNMSCSWLWKKKNIYIFKTGHYDWKKNAAIVKFKSCFHIQISE